MKWLLPILVAACGAPPADGPAVFAKYCTTCHGATGKPNAQMVAQLGVRDLTSPELRARVSVELVVKQVTNGSTNHLMPSFVDMLDEAQIKAVAKFVASPAFLEPRPAPR